MAAKSLDFFSFFCTNTPWLLGPGMTVWWSRTGLGGVKKHKWDGTHVYN